MSKAVSTLTLQKYKRDGRKIVALTAYDYSMAKILDRAGVDLILVGDSLAMVALGHRTTHAVTMDEMLHHTRAVTRGVSTAMVVADLPFMSYQVDITQAIMNAGRFVKEAQAHAVKLEGATRLGDDLLQHLTYSYSFCVVGDAPTESTAIAKTPDMEAWRGGVHDSTVTASALLPDTAVLPVRFVSCTPLEWHVQFLQS